MKALMIGGTGNIGTAVADTLLKRGWEVTLCGRKQGRPDCGFIQTDRTHHGDFEAEMARHGSWDCVIDMVGYTPMTRKVPSGPLPAARRSLFSAPLWTFF